MNAIFYSLGYLGILIYIVMGAIEKYGKTLAALVAYISENALPIVLNILAYNAVLALWYWSEALSAFGLDAGKLNAMTVPVGYMAQSLLTKVIRNLGDKGGIPPQQ
jgi:hypothetical protein